MLILGIESSCDETACAVVNDGREVLSNVIASQIGIHQSTGGVVPEVAARAHVGKLQTVFDKALNEANVSMQDIEAIAVTVMPGLINCLLAGTTFAASLAWIHNKPLIPVNHIHGHLLSAMLGHNEQIDWPVVVLSVSGGHNELYLVNSPTDFKLLGKSLDDAAGEAFDKVAKMLGLDYPGGPSISRVAVNGNPVAFKLPQPLPGDEFNFSFSGLKTAVRNLVESLKKSGEFEEQKANVAASFEFTVAEVLSDKLLNAANKFGAKELHVVGGVSANLKLRETVRAKSSVAVRFPLDFSYCTDNAAMIAGTGFYTDQQNWLSAKDQIKVSPKVEF